MRSCDFLLGLDRVTQPATYDPLHADHADRSEVASRIRRAVSSSGLTSAEFARLVGTSASRLSTYCSGKVTPSAAMLVRIERTAKSMQHPRV